MLKELKAIVDSVPRKVDIWKMDCSSPSVHFDEEDSPACMHLADSERKQGGEMGGQFIYYWTFGVDAETAWKCALACRCLNGTLEHSHTCFSSLVFVMQATSPVAVHVHAGAGVMCTQLRRGCLQVPAASRQPSQADCQAQGQHILVPGEDLCIRLVLRRASPAKAAEQPQGAVSFHLHSRLCLSASSCLQTRFHTSSAGCCTHVGCAHVSTHMPVCIWPDCSCMTAHKAA